MTSPRRLPVTPQTHPLWLSKAGGLAPESVRVPPLQQLIFQIARKTPVEIAVFPKTCTLIDSGATCCCWALDFVTLARNSPLVCAVPVVRQNVARYIINEEISFPLA